MIYHLLEHVQKPHSGSEVKISAAASNGSDSMYHRIHLVLRRDASLEILTSRFRKRVSGHALGSPLFWLAAANLPIRILVSFNRFFNFLMRYLNPQKINGVYGIVNVEFIFKFVNGVPP
ncbi:MAG: hypothetical protein UY61_C0010G0017 [Candidatus Adlerbacteria bacterium GW2011_GWC1_50_9]|uniref:Uncharacterized protein n=1 Tax=Candidatus Adlerbacteria bacterium GW2011_GWC1_50_9 TaxID=1618608 RepID=A0A0G1WQZ2_9BACT|nr:MAG: hypothetical protein UY61_C0010G0017 [Candidatus Adlerbacteria bacterium GW2011_GWC1_50_9]